MSVREPLSRGWKPSSRSRCSSSACNGWRRSSRSTTRRYRATSATIRSPHASSPPTDGRITPMPITRIDHVQLAMPPGREDDAIAFYDGLLGIPQVPKPSHLAQRGGCWFERGELKVHLGVDAEFLPAKKAH